MKHILIRLAKIILWVGGAFAILFVGFTVWLIDQTELTPSTPAPRQQPAADAESAPQQPFQGTWRTTTRESEFDDSTSVFLTLNSDERLSCNPLGQHENAKLTLRCHENTTALFISTNCHLASGFDGYGSVDLRIDNRPAQTLQFNDSTDNDSLGLWTGSKSIPVIRQMLDGETLVVRFTPFNHSPVTTRFYIHGLENALPALRESCGW